MARVTVEDCVIVVPNRFELCLVAINRAKSILSGAPTTLNKKEKPSVISLREIAEGGIDIENIRKNIVRNIKNRGVVSYDQLATTTETIESFSEEIDTQDITLKDNIFIGDDVDVDD